MPVHHAVVPGVMFCCQIISSFVSVSSSGPNILFNIVAYSALCYFIDIAL